MGSGNPLFIPQTHSRSQQHCRVCKLKCQFKADQTDLFETQMLLQFNNYAISYKLNSCVLVTRLDLTKNYILEVI